METALCGDCTVWKLQCSATDNQKHCTDERFFTTEQNVSDHSLRCKRPCDSLIHCTSRALLKLQATPGKTYWIARLNIFQQIRVICHIALNSDVTALNFDCSAMSHTILHACTALRWTKPGRRYLNEASCVSRSCSKLVFPKFLWS